uniref:Cyclin-dependent kinases regulatory subunit n=1 Tax=Caenorhabditis japonica TaxID=281687 RepID=A0A8R1E3G3_CAEJA
MDDIYYSPRYEDAVFEYRHVILPRVLARKLTADRLLSEAEWRRLGVQQSLGWEHYMWHRPEQHILLFRRSLNFSKADEERAKERLMDEMREYDRRQGKVN